MTALRTSKPGKLRVFYTGANTETGDEAERVQFAARLDQIVAEAKRRGKPEIIDRARASLVQAENPCGRAAAREERWSRKLKF